MAQAQEICAQHGIHWLPQKFCPRPQIIAPAFSMLRMVWLIWREVRGGRAQLVHARSYIPAAAALIVYRLTGVPFIFDMRALWPEELITAGRLRRSSLLHRTIVAVERACLQHAAAVVSLTNVAVAHLKHTYPAELDGQKIAVIPTCADLNRFTPAADRPSGPIVHGCIGTLLSGWFRTDWLAAWLSTVAQDDPGARFDIVTRDDKNGVRAALDPNKALGDRLSIGPRLSNDMPEAVRGHDLSVMFFTDGLSKLGSAPTRLAEVLGCGLPVVANAGVGDVAGIVRQKRVGVIIDGPAPWQMKVAFEELQQLIEDPDLPNRCRATAEELFSLNAGTEAYRELYAEILGHPEAPEIKTAAAQTANDQ
ncbi:glycosyltransferase [Planktomarina temperata]|nr:glycosyltransferase [Planktomarina temperata]